MTVTEKPRSRHAVRASTWEPDPRWSKPLAITGWVYVLGYLPHLGVHPLVMGLATPVFAAVWVTRLRRNYQRTDYGESIPLGMTWLAVLSAITSGVWLIEAGWHGPLPIVGWLLLAGVVFGAWWAGLYTHAPKVAAAVDRMEAEQEAKRAATEWTELFKNAGLNLEVIKSEPTRAGVALVVKGADEKKPVAIQALRDKLPDLTVKAAAALAKHGTIVREGDIRVEATEAAHIHVVHICTKHILAQKIPYEPAEHPATVADAMDIWVYEAGDPVLLRLDGEQASHGLIIGATGSGKTTAANSIVGRVGECVDAAIVVVGTDKLVPFVYPWLKPWLEGRSERPAIDGVAGQDPKHVLLMLAELYKEMRRRNARLSNVSRHAATPEEPAIVALVEETGHIARSAETVKTFDGAEMNFSRLIFELTRAGRSALVHVILLNTSHLHDAFGQWGAEIDRNTPFRACLKTMSSYDGSSTLPGLPGAMNTTRLRDHSMLVQPSADTPQIHPAKSYYLEGDAIHPVAIRNAALRPTVDFGLVWRGRWNPDRLPELAAAAKADGLKWPTLAIAEEAQPDLDEELRQLLELELPRDEPRPTGALPDADSSVAALEAAAANLGKAHPLPDLLAAVMDILEGDGAPTDWVPTRELAIRLGRVDREAAQEDLQDASERLGTELAALHPDIRTTQKRSENGRARGYDVKMLRRIAAKIARGEA